MCVETQPHLPLLTRTLYGYISNLNFSPQWLQTELLCDTLSPSQVGADRVLLEMGL